MVDVRVVQPVYVRYVESMVNFSSIEKPDARGLTIEDDRESGVDRNKFLA
jgi:hypothetical protein